MTIVISALLLTLMEIVLGIDNIIFIGMISSTIENKKEAEFARKLGIALALIIRIIALIFIARLAQMTEPLFLLPLLHGVQHPVSLHDIILVGGGLFLIYKSASEIHELFLEEEAHLHTKKGTVMKVIIQIILIDLVFSADSILTAIGLVKEVWIMIMAVVISMSLMFVLSGKIAAYIEARPSLKVLALAFLLMVGSILIMEGCGVEIDKGYIYSAMAFAVIIEFFNTKLNSKRKKKYQVD